MSLILEALRKSEAERRRGEAPDLRVELPPPPPPKPGVPRVAWLAAGVVVAVLAAAALWPRSEQGAAEGDARPAGADGAAGTGEGSEPGRLQRAGAYERQAPVDGAARPGSTQHGFPAVERIEVPGGTVAPEPAPDRPLAPPPMATRAAEEAAAAADAGGTADRQSMPRTVPTVPVPEAAPAPATARRADPADAGDGALRITSLPPGQRERLPEARLSLHMWNEDPARRFAVIDGQRRVEGDRLGEATIVAIDREGVLLDLDGQRVRLPLP